jgi:hypothetical protein
MVSGTEKAGPLSACPPMGSATAFGPGDFGTSRWQFLEKSTSISSVRERGLAAGYVEGFGCRPLTGVRHTPAAGVRKPPLDETAMGSGGRWRGHYGDLAAAAQEMGCR